MNLFWGAKFDHGMLLCDVPREWVGLRMGQCPKEANAWSQRSWTKRIWEESSLQTLVLPMLKHQRHNAASNGQQILLLILQNYVLCLPACGAEILFWASVWPIIFGACLHEVSDPHRLVELWVDFVFFLLSTMRLDVDMETQALTKIDDSDLWFETNEDLGGWNKLLMVIRIFLVLGLNSYRHHRCSFCPTKFCGQPTMWEPMVDTGSHLTVGIYCKLFRLCSLGEAKQYEE